MTCQYLCSSSTWLFFMDSKIETLLWSKALTKLILCFSSGIYLWLTILDYYSLKIFTLYFLCLMTSIYRLEIHVLSLWSNHKNDNPDCVFAFLSNIIVISDIFSIKHVLFNILPCSKGYNFLIQIGLSKMIGVKGLFVLND